MAKIEVDGDPTCGVTALMGDVAKYVLPEIM